MKKIMILMSMLLFVVGVYATNFNDPELQDYLDKPFVKQGKDVYVLSSYVNKYNSDYWDINGEIVNCFITMAIEWFGYSREMAGMLNDQAYALYQTAYGTVPTDNWSFMIDVDTNTVIDTYQATNFTKNMDEEGTMNLDRENSYGEMQHLEQAYLTGKNIKIENEDGTTTKYHVANAVNYSPIILDLDNDGKPCVSNNDWAPHAPKFYKERTAIFDMTGDNKPELIEWLGTKDGLLVMPDSDPNCPVKNATNLFGTAGGYKDGYEKMAIVLDLDKNGWAEGAELNGLFVWTDVNGNAKVDKGEMTSLQELGVEKISVEHEKFESVCVIKGQKVKTWDWWPCGYELVKTK